MDFNYFIGTHVSKDELEAGHECDKVKKIDLGKYYRRKVAEGKNKMSVINAVRNNIIPRIYAVIKNQNIYQNNLVL